ncbi:hypothetical protein BU16DRAFT_534482 [Lophium mytilinum]|uniref:Uncharacterized protein n=1 Tax=Lophium mytilinum TaxID=390894 RepID=A0A6A6RBL2_9PEZI|nr:hypothetical protein BU16DRAFT_534482 [Lophium mytilinum]
MRYSFVAAGICLPILALGTPIHYPKISSLDHHIHPLTRNHTPVSSSFEFGAVIEHLATNYSKVVSNPTPRGHGPLKKEIVNDGPVPKSNATNVNAASCDHGGAINAGCPGHENEDGKVVADEIKPRGEYDMIPNFTSKAFARLLAHCSTRESSPKTPGCPRYMYDDGHVAAHGEGDVEAIVPHKVDTTEPIVPHHIPTIDPIVPHELNTTEPIVPHHLPTIDHRINPHELNTTEEPPSRTPVDVTKSSMPGISGRVLPSDEHTWAKMRHAKRVKHVKAVAAMKNMTSSEWLYLYYSIGQHKPAQNLSAHLWDDVKEIMGPMTEAVATKLILENRPASVDKPSDGPISHTTKDPASRNLTARGVAPAAEPETKDTEQPFMEEGDSTMQKMHDYTWKACNHPGVVNSHCAEYPIPPSTGEKPPANSTAPGIAPTKADQKPVGYPSPEPKK